MDEIEEANKAATESCHRVLDYLSRPSDQFKYGHLMGDTMDAVFKFKRVVSLLNSDLGHGRIRKLQKFQAPLPHYIFLDNANCRPDNISTHTQAFSGSNSQANPFHGMGVNSRNTLSLRNPSLDLNLNGKLPLQFFHEASSKQFQLLQQQKQQQNLQFQHLQMKQQSEMLFRRNNCGVNLSFDSSSSCTASVSSTRSFLSSLSIDASVANMDGNAFHLVGAQQLSDPSSHSLKRKCPVKGNDRSARCGSIGKCHCSKKRKHRVKRSIRVPAISNRLADIPSDDYSWRKYGQKPIKGSPHPRGYYKCSSARGCPARKHVERCLDDPSMLSITYESEHNHPRVAPSQLTNT